MSTMLADIRDPKDVQALDRNGLDALAADIRSFLLRNISATGGHIGANLGTIELTIAMHACFRSPDVPFLFDTGHQGYTHKLLTGRAHLFPTLNQYDGMSRFLTHLESQHDPIEASHAGTAISVGLGMALSRKLRGNEDHVVAVVGDSALVEGASLEALNHAAVEDTNLVVIVNDNGFAISPGFGAVHEALQSGDGKAKALFESLGCTYIGPVDGHNITEMTTALEEAKRAKSLPVVHAKTIKGNGWAPADNHPFRLHFSFPFDPETGTATGNSTPQKTYPDYAAQTLERRMDSDDKITCITPSTIYATGLAGIFSKYPERCFDPGMEEQHALTMTVGMALDGAKPVIAYQSTFLQRAFDQIIHDVCFMNVPTLILSARSGFSGYDNPTHHGIYDIAFLRSIPNLRVFYPKDGPELQTMIDVALDELNGPTLIMMPYGPVHDFGLNSSTDKAGILKPEVFGDGDDMVMITVGNKFAAAREAQGHLNAKGLRTRLVNIRQIKPLPEQELMRLIGNTRKVAVVEEAVLDGGLGSQIGAMLLENGYPGEFLRHGLPCKFIEPGSNEELEDIYKLDGKGIIETMRTRWPSLNL